MEHLRQRIETASRAYSTLMEVIVDRPTPVERDAAIHRFEYTVETTWKACERYLRVVHGLSAASPKRCIRLAREVGLLTDEEAVTAIEMIDDRNLTPQAYNEILAEKIYSKFLEYEKLLDRWIEKMRAGIEERIPR